MVQLGRHFGQGPASLAEIAAVEDLPRAYLEQLVMSLRDAGLVTSTRGELNWTLRQDPRVVVLERRNARALAPMIAGVSNSCIAARSARRPPMLSACG